MRARSRKTIYVQTFEKSCLTTLLADLSVIGKATALSEAEHAAQALGFEVRVVRSAIVFVGICSEIFEKNRD